MIVLDASAVIEMLLQTEVGAPMAERILTSETSLHAPHLLDVEVAQVLRRFVGSGQLKEERSSRINGASGGLPTGRKGTFGAAGWSSGRRAACFPAYQGTSRGK